MAGVAGVDSRLNKALQSFLIEWKGHNSASLTLKSVKGELSVTLKMKLGRYGEKTCRGCRLAPASFAGESDEQLILLSSRKQQSMLLLLLLSIMLLLLSKQLVILLNKLLQLNKLPLCLGRLLLDKLQWPGFLLPLLLPFFHLCLPLLPRPLVPLPLLPLLVPISFLPLPLVTLHMGHNVLEE